MSGKLKFKFLLIFVITAILAYSFAFAFRLPKWFDFRRPDALDEWEEKVFRGRVLYSVVIGKAEGYLHAYSENAASGILYRIKFSPKKTPMVSWKWQVEKFPDKGNRGYTGNGWIERDDYAARFYIIFPSTPFFNFTKCLEYVWDKSLPKGTILTSPYFGNIKIIVLESGEQNLGQWVYEKRNIYEDFKKAFGREPSSVGGIAIMTDTDNTLSTAEANYGGIKVGYKNERE